MRGIQGHNLAIIYHITTRGENNSDQIYSWSIDKEVWTEGQTERQTKRGRYWRQKIVEKIGQVESIRRENDKQADRQTHLQRQGERQTQLQRQGERETGRQTSSQLNVINGYESFKMKKKNQDRIPGTRCVRRGRSLKVRHGRTAGHTFL